VLPLLNRRVSPHQLLAPVTLIDHMRGPPHAPVMVVEYGDFECPGCREVAPVVRLLIDEYPGHVRVVFRPFPLERIHAHALLAAEAAECAGAQGKFWEMHDLLFTNQANLRQRNLLQYAEKTGVDMARFTGELDDEVYRQRVRESIEGALRSGVSGTPTFFVNGQMVDMRHGVRALLDAIEASIQETSS
jgi:protein-disulfide isomerase